MKHIISFRFILFLFCLALLHPACKKDSDNNTSTLPNTAQYITWEINGVKGQVVSPDSLSGTRIGNTTHLTGYSVTNTNNVMLLIDGNAATGTYPITSFDMFVEGKSYEDSGTPLQATITKYGEVKDYIQGSYTGNVKLSGTVLPIKGDFRLKRRE